MLGHFGQLGPLDVTEPRYRLALADQESIFELEFRGRTYLQRLAPLADGNDVIVGALGFTRTSVTTVGRSLRYTSPKRSFGWLSIRPRPARLSCPCPRW